MPATLLSQLAEAVDKAALALEQVRTVAALLKDKVEADDRDYEQLERDNLALRARVAQLEGQQPGPPVDPPPSLSVIPEEDGLSVEWINADRIVVVPTGGRGNPQVYPPLVVPTGASSGETTILYSGIKWPQFGPGWDLTLWAERGDRKGAEANVRVLTAPVTPSPLPDIIVGDAVMVPPPPNAQRITDPQQALAAIVKNRSDKKPLHIAVKNATARFRLEPGNENVWFDGGSSKGITGGNDWEAAISWPHGTRNCHIQRWAFEDCTRGIYVRDLTGNIVANTFNRGRQAFHVVWTDWRNPPHGCRITHNAIHAMLDHDVELRTDFLPTNLRWKPDEMWNGKRVRDHRAVTGVVFAYNKSTGKPAWRPEYKNGVHDRMVWSLAMGHGEIEVVGNDSFGGAVAFEVMNYARFRDNIIRSCRTAFSVAGLSWDVNIDLTKNQLIDVEKPIEGYGHDGAPWGVRNHWTVTQ